MSEPTGCAWLVRKASGNPEPDSPEDCYVVVECGEPVVPGARFPMCPFHLEAMEMDPQEFEDRVEAGESWS